MKKFIKGWLFVSVIFIGVYIVKLTEVSRKVTFVVENPPLHKSLEEHEADIILTMKSFTILF
jgi:hypothetical protein